jgi:hypothetical protein
MREGNVMGETRFLMGEPKPPNMAVRERIKALTIYDSRYHRETLLSGHNTISINASSRAGAIFAGLAAVLLVVTWIIF